jgi:hypothetical protein
MTPFLQGRKKAGTPSLVAPQATFPVRLPSMVKHVPSQDHGPSVEVVKDGDKVVRLIISCSCGERMEVECLYSS